ncbi:hypothetical protein CCO03_04565 [Comamonas serinivorans]|uniref:Chlorhexidine efflux transporter domain-containing protein n=1 Tax=Comamonas serinivorans TaxID=1082851 RepID=A0A1Y0EL53_9BURK|nr:hypothetical protein CCO03_04565 [Comamonas serinivorans]
MDVNVSSQALVADLQGPWRRVLFVAVYEALAIAVTTLGLDAATGQGAAHAGAMAVTTSAIAIAWNLLFNGLFERWEARQTVKGRSLARRVAHAIGFEGGLVLVFVPLFAWWFQVGWAKAAAMQAGLLVFFMAYTFVYNWCFDRLFGLPASAR